MDAERGHRRPSLAAWCGRDRRLADRGCGGRGGADGDERPVRRRRAACRRRRRWPRPGPGCGRRRRAWRQPLAAVLPHAGEDDAGHGDGPGRATEWNRTSTDGRWPLTGSTWRASAARRPARHLQMGVAAGGEIDVSWHQRTPPSTASVTVAREALSREAPAKLLVKVAGMCCVTTVGGQFGRAGRQDVQKRFDPAGRGADGQEWLRGRAKAVVHRAGLARVERANAERARDLHLVGQIAEGVWAETPARGLGHGVDRPQLQRRQGHLGAAWVRVETMTTGMGRSRIIFSRNSSPFMLGISTSSVRTSGFSSLILARASSGSAAVPTTAISGSRRRTAAMQAAHGGAVVDDQDAHRGVVGGGLHARPPSW